MSLRVVMVEGPDDVNALREIATRHLGAVKSSRKPQNPRAAAFDTASGQTVEVHPVENAKSALPKTFASRLRGRPATTPEDSEHLTHLAILYDPDEDRPTNKLALDVAREIERTPQGWQLTPIEDATVDAWTAKRSDAERIELRVIPWTAPGPAYGGLVDGQNLDRLLNHVAALTYPSELATVDAWLTLIHERRDALSLKAPKWKAATLLWAALVDDQAVTDAGIHARFFGQHGACVPHVKAALEATKLWDELRALFA